MRDRIIMSAAEEINFRGFKFTMSDLAKRLSISKTSLYEHFSSKNELVTTLIDMAFADARAQEEAIFGNPGLSAAEKFQALITVRPRLFGPINDRIYYDLRKDYPDEWSKVAVFRQKRLDGLISLLEQGVETQAVRRVNFIVLRQLISGAMNDLFNYRFLAESNMTYPDAMKALADVVLYGITPRNK